MMPCVVVFSSQVVVCLGGSDYSDFEPFNDNFVKGVHHLIAAIPTSSTNWNSL